ncbi:unnamed protein product [Didymodactylos carnosus]|uniref:OTU domain-containing protein n=1 Tax=Didymodactylos carnosus TaxID=1234261 RepID=A0A8S2D7K9_9BILA|nr:unnamed protein product [Didymodactylos carnosus]CAF3610145.1 unnamed protein product [Didymodactylos carnosus]
MASLVRNLYNLYPSAFFFFQHFLIKLQYNKNFRTIQRICQTIYPALVKFPFNFKPIQYFDPQVHQLDIIFQQYVALCEDTEGDTEYFSNNEQQLIALDVKGDGNCLYHCITLLGEMANHYTVELRVRNIIELAMNAAAYLQFYKLYDTNLKAYIVRSMLYDRRWAKKTWDLFGLCTVLNCNIRSVFPSVNTFTNMHPSAPLPPQKIMNKTFKPRQNIATNTILIMWSRGISPEDWIIHSAEDIWAPNHYVPLIKPRVSLHLVLLIVIVDEYLFKFSP